MIKCILRLKYYRLTTGVKCKMLSNFSKRLNSDGRQNGLCTSPVIFSCLHMSARNPLGADGY